ncbi:MAG: hypothetical protein HQK53_08155 [Oligoflexia bacterium]|nr:hypothetical protein [Oligoflexia bacterium]
MREKARVELNIHDGGEIDLILSKPRRKPVLVKIKSSDRIDEIEINHLVKYAQELGSDKIFYISQNKNGQKIKNVNCMPWDLALKEIFSLG